MEPTAELNGDFSEPGTAAVPWAKIERLLEDSEMFWLSTVRPDGRPHVTPLPAVWWEGVLHFCTGDQEQKSANLVRNPAVVLTTGVNRLREGVDVIVEGTAVRVTDRHRLTALAGLWKSKLDWDYEVGSDAFRDPDGRTGWVFGVAPAKVLSFGKSPYTQTRYRFS
ncbi:pyridoxamine 5'-phosphate oxidase family protein [Nucisporomicrobium flavum]|jgi:general stress protein 26|uniref:pyridoxamine 5'-phosphate oxidase family protein n=1 Tax=Nucisporomicrobium flavum TaxID=2785915 RepID=UPI0018F62C54|nr:pyridoxamine 5'-phosphate oxidase family protein [Nucisporomicrobium flavum]